MDKYSVKNIYNQINRSENTILKVNVPGSKSITNRALLLATLADGDSILNGVLFSDDSRHFIECVKSLGIGTKVDEPKGTVSISGCNNMIPTDTASLNVGSAGTAARFISAVLGVSKGEFHIDSSEQMKKRPMKPLIDSLKVLGCEVKYLGEEGHFPFILNANGFKTNNISINIDSSSQFLSALMIASVLSESGLTIEATGSHGMAYIEMTKQMMEQFGVNIIQNGNTFIIDANQKYNARSYNIEPDVSAACYFYALGTILGLNVCVPGVHFDSLQGDVEFIKVLEKMGVNAKDTDEGIVLTPPENGVIKGVEIDMSSFSDQAITLAAIAPYASSPVTITGIGHIRLQESDRLSAIATELSRMGIRVDEGDDRITIYPGTPHKAEIETYNDHRIAMGFSLTGLRSDGITILDPLCCRKTFENYFEVLDSVIAKIS